MKGSPILTFDQQRVNPVGNYENKFGADGAPDIAGVDEKTNRQYEYDIKTEDPQDDQDNLRKYMYREREFNYHQDEQ